MENKTLNLLVPALLSILLICGFIAFSSGLSLIVSFVPAMIISYICYLFSTYRKMPDPDRIVPIYFFSIGIQLLHFTEEFIGEFYSRFPFLIDGSPGYSINLFVGFNMWAYFVFILGGIGLYYGKKIPTLIVWFFIIMGVAGNAIVHLIFCIMNGGYFPGFYTSLIYWFLAPILIKRMFGK
ncbi:HXXEE domain-containing protein [Saprospiraceae bacterium]|jgi:hypothetical protein|nr:HXXEE domain-containing protein [Bacteroidota bacterium]MDB4728267.1 HXXEE domain-containing protein [Saprospiraceae bacterium]MDF1865872.1 HXXEE domain-containing protein [Saprospiraceae bacterium]